MATKKKRIGFNQVLTSERASGAQQRELIIFPKLIKLLTDSDVECFVYVSRDVNESFLKDWIPKHNNVKTVRTPIPSVPTYKRIIMGLSYWNKQVTIDRLDAFHTAYHPAPQLTIPVVFTVHDLRFRHVPETYPTLRKAYLNITVPLTFKRATHVVAVSQDTKRDIIDFYQYPPSDITVAHNSINPRFDTMPSKDDVRQARLSYSLPDRYILYVGHLEKRKNLERLCLAYREFHNNVSTDYALVILGKPSYGGYRDLLEKNDLQELRDKIIFTGYVDDSDLPAVYKGSQLLAFPSLHEGFGVPILEAMACGVPVLTSNVSAMPEIAGDAAIIVDPYNVQEIAQGLAKGVFDSACRERIVEAGSTRLQQYSPDTSAAAIKNAFDQVLNPQTQTQCSV